MCVKGGREGSTVIPVESEVGDGSSVCDGVYLSSHGACACSG